VNYAAPDDRLANETYKRHFGPTYYSFNYGLVHFVMLDNVEYKGQGNGRFERNTYRGYVSDEQIAWLRNDLRFVARDRLLVIVTHIPLLVPPILDGDEFLTEINSLNTVNLSALLEVLAGFERVYGIAGHDTSNSWRVAINHRHGWHGLYPIEAHTLIEARHRWRGPRDERGVRAADMQDGSPNGYYVLSFEGADYRTRFKAAGYGTDHRMRITLEPAANGSPGEKTSAEAAPLAGQNTSAHGDAPYRIGRFGSSQQLSLVVHVFDGGDEHRVAMSLDGGAFEMMEHLPRTDPTMELLFARHQGTADHYERPVLSSHLWQRTLRPDLGFGVHSVRVRVHDPYGEVFEASQLFEIE
jgi:hypothetical protein